MELLTLVFIWPIIIFSLGMAFIAFGDFSGSDFLFFISWPLIIVFALLSKKIKHQGGKEYLRNFGIGLSLTLLFPILIKYFINAFNGSIIAIIISMVIGFILVVVGLFEKKIKILIYSNICGGALILIYTYSQLWSLGQGTRIIAAAFGLIIAVIISVFKLKDKLK